MPIDFVAVAVGVRGFGGSGEKSRDWRVGSGGGEEWGGGWGGREGWRGGGGGGGVDRGGGEEGVGGRWWAEALQLTRR